MIIPFALLALLSSPSGPPARPLAVSVQVAGKSPSRLRAELKAASEAVCRAQLSSPLDAMDVEQCVGATYDAAVFQARHAQPAERPLIRDALLVR